MIVTVSPLSATRVNPSFLGASAPSGVVYSDTIAALPVAKGFLNLDKERF